MEEASEPLAITLELRPAAPPAGAAVLLNRGSSPVRVWKPGNSWGDPALSFEVARDGATSRIVPQPQEYTRNLPTPVEVPSGATHERPFDLGDGRWEAGAPLDELLVRGALLTAVYEIEPSPEAEEHGVWTGRLRSEPVRLDS